MTEGLAGNIASTVLGAVLGVGGTYLFDLRKAQRERAQASEDGARERARLRGTVATALLQDLRALEWQLSEIFFFAPASRYVPSRHRLYFDVHAGDVRLFAAPTIQVVSEFYRRYQHLLAAYDLLPRLKAEGTRTPEEIEYELQSQAGYALQALPAAADALKNEGGLIDQTDDWAPVTFPTLPVVPRPAFAATARMVAEAQSNKTSRGV